MADDISNTVILQELHAMKTSLEGRIDRVEAKLDNLADSTNKRFEEARLERQALQEDLVATMHMLAKHETKLARL